MRKARAKLPGNLTCALLAALFLLVSCAERQTAPSARCSSYSPFVTSHESTLCANGLPLHLIGYNWHWMGTACDSPTAGKLEQTFSQIQIASDGNIVRTAFYQSGSNNGSFANFDRYIAAAKRHNLYILPILTNEWTNCEPLDAAKTLSWYESGYKLAQNGYPLSYREYVRRLVAHYANEPVIAFWQLVNEPDALGETCGARAAHVLKAFADDMVSVIKSVDPHHLVDLGVPGTCAADNAADYETIVASSIDVADVWHDYHQATIPMPVMLEQRLQVLQRLHKPAYVGESGICANVDVHGFCTGPVSKQSLMQRALFFDAKLSAGFRAGLSGYMIWNRGSASVRDDIGPGDPTENTLARYALDMAR